MYFFLHDSGSQTRGHEHLLGIPQLSENYFHILSILLNCDIKITIELII